MNININAVADPEGANLAKVRKTKALRPPL